MTQAILESMETPDGPFMVLVDCDGAVMASGWTDDVPTLLARIRAGDRPAHVEEGTTGLADVVAAYYGGDLRAIDAVPVRQFGTALQVQGWAELRRIRPGAPLTYTEFAAALGSPHAVRAAAGICARNAPALFVPCHRVTRTDGSMGGFAWGVDIKRSLLAREYAVGADALF